MFLFRRYVSELIVARNHIKWQCVEKRLFRDFCDVLSDNIDVRFDYVFSFLIVDLCDEFIDDRLH